MRRTLHMMACMLTAAWKASTTLHCIYLFTVCGLGTTPHGNAEGTCTHGKRHSSPDYYLYTTTLSAPRHVRCKTGAVRRRRCCGVRPNTHPHSIGLANPILAIPNPLYEYTLTGGHDGSRALGEAAELRRLREPVGAALHRSATLVRRGRPRVQLPGHLALVLVRVRG